MTRPKLNVECRDAFAKHFAMDKNWDHLFDKYKRQMILSKPFMLVNRRLMRNCQFMDTSLSQTFRLIYLNGLRTSIIMKEPLFFAILKLLKPTNFTMGGFYATDLQRIQQILERSGNKLLEERLQKISISVQYSNLSKTIEFLQELKKLAPNLYSFEINMFVNIDQIHKRGIEEILEDLRELSQKLKEFVEIVSINLNIGITAKCYDTYLTLLLEPKFFKSKYKLIQSKDIHGQQILCFNLSFEECLVRVKFQKNAEWTYNPMTQQLCMSRG